MTDDPPRWLTEKSRRSWFPFVVGVAFVALTLATALAAESIINRIPPSVSWRFGQNLIQLQPQPGLSLFFAWDLAAILSMFGYFAFYWVRMFTKDGLLRRAGRFIPSLGTALLLFVLGEVFLFIAFLAGILFALSVPFSMPIQLIFLTLAAYFFWLADRRVMKKHPERKIEIEFKLFVEFVDLPMAISFTALTVFYFIYIEQHDIQRFSAFMSGAIAFQIIAFNVAFAFLLRFTEAISRGKTIVLLTSEGDFANGYAEFQQGWWNLWKVSSPTPSLPANFSANKPTVD